MILLFSGILLPAQNPYIQHYTTVDGLPSNMVYQVYQDSQKFIWFATDAGVARFDGTGFTYYRKPDGLSCNDVVRIKEDSFGRVWFFNLNATLNFYYQNSIFNGTNAPFLDSLVSEEFFRDFFEDEDKTLYFYYNHQPDIFSLDSQNHIKKYKLPSMPVMATDENEPFEGMVIRYLNKSSGNEFNIWSLGGFYRMKELSGKLTSISDTILVKRVFPLAGNKLCLLLDIKKEDKGYFFPLKLFYNEFLVDSLSPEILLETEFVSSVIEDSSNILWISTFDKGVFCYKDNKVINHFDINEAQAIIQDHEGNIWISSLKDGVYKISPYINRHTHYDINNFQNNGILALNHHLNNGVWCTNGKTVYLLQNEQLFSSGFQREESSFNQILQVNSHTLLVGEIGTRQYALEGMQMNHSLKKINFNRVGNSPKPLKEITINLSGDEINSFNAFYLAFINPVKLFSDVKNVAVSERIYKTFYNSKNELIVNAKRNYLFRNDSLIPCTELSCFDNKIITDHLILDDGTELFNLEGDSLFLLKNEHLFNLTLAFGYPIDLLISDMDYHRSTLFFSTTRNIYICENLLNILDNKPVHLEPVDISFRNIHDILFSNGDDMLYIASDDGLTAIPYSILSEITANSPIPYFQSIRINDKDEIMDQKSLTVTGRNRISFVFGSINYSFSPVIYSYKVEGADDDWTNGTQTNVVYQNLPRGVYNFKLRVRKPTSPWSESIEYAITIRATIWQHPLFYITLSLFIAGIIFLIILWRKNAEMRRREVEH